MQQTSNVSPIIDKTKNENHNDAFISKYSAKVFQEMAEPAIEKGDILY